MDMLLFITICGYAALLIRLRQNRCASELAAVLDRQYAEGALQVVEFYRGQDRKTSEPIKQINLVGANGVYRVRNNGTSTAEPYCGFDPRCLAASYSCLVRAAKRLYRECPERYMRVWIPPMFRSCGSLEWSVMIRPAP